ncbi:hypothetical protein D3C73_652390 [compost metagenome]
MQLHAEQVQGVVDADAHAEGDHRQGRDFHADAHGHHQGFAEDRGQHQRQQRHQRGAPAAEGDQAEQRHRRIDVQQHGAIGFAHDDVGRRLNARRTGRQQELAIFGAVFLGELVGNRHHGVEGFGLVILEEGDHRHQRTISIEQLRRVDRGLLRGVVEHVLVALDAVELGVAFVGAGGDLAYRVDQGRGRLHARILLQLPGQAVGEHQGLVVQAAFRRGLDHHREQVAGQRVMLGDVGVVAVVARVGTQFRRTAFKVADFQVEADHETTDAHQHRDQHRAGRPLGGGEAVEQIPEFAEAFVVFGAGVDFQCALGGFGANADIGQCHRHQQQRSEDQHRDADAGGDRQVLDHRDVDQHQHRKTHGIGQQRGDAGNEQTAEGIARSDQLVGAAGDVLHDAVHLLRGVGHADGEDQERHQHRVRIDGVAEPGDDAQLPDHRDQRAADHQQGAAHATGVGVDDDQRRDDGQAEEHHHLDQAVDQVAHQFGEADHPHLVLAGAFDPGLTRRAVAGVFDLVAQLLFEHLREGVVVDALATGGGFVQQRHDQHGRLEVAGHQAADNAGAGNVLAQLFDLIRLP